MMLLYKNRRFSHLIVSLLGLVTVALLQGCWFDDNGSSPPTYSIGGTVSGLTGTLVLQNNGGGDKTITENGAFSFGNGFSDKTSYAITISTQPSGQACNVTNSSGSVAGADISNITVSCVSDQDASGIYTGTAELNTTPTKAMPTDLKGMIYNNHFYIFSVSQHVLYDGTITSTSGNDITGTVDVYVNGALQYNDAAMTGFVTSEDQVTLTINGAEKGNGVLTLTYSDIYKRGATLLRIEAPLANLWGGLIYAVTDSSVSFRFEEGSLAAGFTPKNATGCAIDPYDAYSISFVIPSDLVNLYELKNYEITDNDGCSYKGQNFYGYATVVDTGAGTDKELWFVLTNGMYSLFSITTH